MKIQAVRRRTKRSNRFCGPAVISALTGMDTADAAARLRELSGRKSITGVTIDLMIRALRDAGFEVSLCAEYERRKPTLAQWIKGSHREGKTFVILARRHWQVIQGDKYVCGQSVEVVDFKHKACAMRARVKGVWEISKAA